MPTKRHFQLDSASNDQAKAVREVERSLDKALFDNTRAGQAVSGGS